MAQKVPQLFLYLGGIGAVFLLAATIYLVILNWSPKIISTPVIILVGAVVSTFISIVLVLQESKIHGAFVSAVIIDKRSGFPALVPGDLTINDKLTPSLYSLGSLSRPFSVKEDRLMVASPSTHEEITLFCQELLQYQIFRIFVDRQSRVLHRQTTAQTVKSIIKIPAELSEYELITGEKIVDIVSDNRFSKSDSELFLLRNSHLKVPAGTKINLGFDKSASKYTITFEKSYFFFIAISVSGGGSTSVPPVLPEGVSASGENVKNYQTFLFPVETTAVFYKWTSENKRTDEYKKWADWLFSVIRTELVDLS